MRSKIVLFYCNYIYLQGNFTLPYRKFGSIRNDHRDIWSMPKGSYNLILSKTSMNIVSPLQMALNI